MTHLPVFDEEYIGLIKPWDDFCADAYRFLWDNNVRTQEQEEECEFFWFDVLSVMVHERCLSMTGNLDAHL